MSLLSCAFDEFSPAIGTTISVFVTITVAIETNILSFNGNWNMRYLKNIQIPKIGSNTKNIHFSNIENRL